MLKYRILTACVLIPIALLAIFILPTRYFQFFILFVLILATWEWTRLVGLIEPIARLIFIASVLALTWLASLIHFQLIVLVATLTWVWLLFAVINYNKGNNPLGLQAKLLRALLCYLLIIPCYYAVIYVHNQQNLGPIWLLWLFCVTWATDIGAYFIGKKWGKTRLAVRISPNKTRAGVVGGIGLAFLVALIGVFFVTVSWQRRLLLLALWMVTIILSIFGDLAVSLLKRLAGVKDTGQLLPGHGGVLDRLDSLLATSVIFSLGISLLF